ncbi:hypothetical protein K2X33_04730 [bacterium]|nr:hypothetical protein [bacterium]
MKYIFLFFALLSPGAYADELLEGHWYSERMDSTNRKIGLYENWYEEDPVAGRVFRQKFVRDLPWTEPPVVDSVPANPLVEPPSDPQTTVVCFARSYLPEHEPSDRKDDSCVDAHFKGIGVTQDQAAYAALRVCRRGARNRESCEVIRKEACFVLPAGGKS